MKGNEAQQTQASVLGDFAGGAGDRAPDLHYLAQ